MIFSIQAAQRLDSRGKPTVKVTVTTDKGEFTALVPSGASVGDYEAHELRDGNPTVYGGNSVMKAVHNVENVIGPALIEKKFDVAHDLVKIDQFVTQLDGTKDKSRLGANAILGISMECARAGAAAKGVPLYKFLQQEAQINRDFVLPTPFFNVLNGGKHSGNKMAFQEFMIAPTGAESITHAIQIGCEVYQSLKKVLIAKFGSPGNVILDRETISITDCTVQAVGVGDEGGFAPPISHPSEALDLLTAAVSQAGHQGRVKFAIDPASSEFFKSGNYDLGFKAEESHVLSPSQLADLYHSLLQKYPIILLEDPFSEDDWESWANFKKTCPVELVGDDLLATNVDRMKIAQDKDVCNSLLLKINQIGTISEAINAARKSFEYGWHVFISHRSGETTDDFIADLAVGLGTGHLKSGSPCRGERVVKYNRLMDIEDELRSSGLKYIYAESHFA